MAEKTSVWFQDITSTLTIDENQAHLIAELIFNALANHKMQIADLPEPFRSDTAPRIVFLSISDNLTPAKVILGSGRGLLQAIHAALAQAEKLSATLNLHEIKLDIVQEVTKMKMHPVKQQLQYDRSLYGIAFDDKIRLAYLSDELVTKTIVNSKQRLRPSNIIKNYSLTSAQKKVIKDNKSFGVFQFTVQSIYHSRKLHAPLYRGHRLFRNINSDLLLEAATAAGNYLQNAVNEDGLFIYNYLPKKDEQSDDYNILRHAGTIYSMLELYELNRSESLIKSAKRALKNLMDKAKPTTIEGKEVLCIVEDDFVKLGGNALALLATSKYISITKDTSYIEPAKKLAQWMKAAQNDSGAFDIHKQHFATKEIKDFISEYYPGEAIFSLVRFYQVDPNPLWLDMAQNAANYIINKRDKDKKIAKLEHDHWLLYGLNELYQFRPEKIWATHAYKICQSIFGIQHLKQDPLDYFGGFYNPPRSTPTATRAEGLIAAYHLLKNNHYEKEATEALNAAKLCIQFQLQTQFFPERTLYFPNRKKALGGFSRSLTDYSIRIDYVQHNISSILGLYKIQTNYARGL